jgi:hypothetical protein
MATEVRQSIDQTQSAGCHNNSYHAASGRVALRSMTPPPPPPGTPGFPRCHEHNLPLTSVQLRSFNGNGDMLFLPVTDVRRLISLRLLIAFQ